MLYKNNDDLLLNDLKYFVNIVTKEHKLNNHQLDGMNEFYDNGIKYILTTVFNTTRSFINKNTKNTNIAKFDFNIYFHNPVLKHPTIPGDTKKLYPSYARHYD